MATEPQKLKFHFSAEFLSIPFLLARNLAFPLLSAEFRVSTRRYNEYIYAPF